VKARRDICVLAREVLHGDSGERVDPAFMLRR
jgi:hypothetical protein